MDIEYVDSPDESEAITIDNQYYKSETVQKPIEKLDLLFYQKYMVKQQTQKRRVPPAPQPLPKKLRTAARPELFATLEEYLQYKQ